MKRLSLLLAAILISITFSCNNQKEEANEAETASVETTSTFATVDELVEATLKSIKQITVEELKAKIDAEEQFLLIDVRELDEFNSAFISGAVNIPRGMLEFNIAKETFWEEEMLYMPKKDELIIVYCKKGHRGALSTKALESLGYTNVKNIQGGFGKWEEKFPNDIEKNETAKPAEGGVVTKSSGGGC